jgi:hypothetical protein
MSCTRDDISSVYIERPHLNNNQGEYCYEHEEHAYDIHVVPAYRTNRYRSEDVFASIVSIFNFNIILIIV